MSTQHIVISVLDQFAKDRFSEFLARYSAGQDAKYHLLHVAEPPTPRMPGDPKWEAAREQCLKTGEAVVDNVATFLRKVVPDAIIVEHVREGKPAEEILKLAREQKASLIVMGTRNRKGLRRLFLGSVSSDVAQHAQCSVIILKHNRHLFTYTERVADPV